jgi:Fe2+ transport system protein FeoA
MSTVPPASTLGALAVGERAEIVHVGCPRAVTRRLLEMGLLPGTQVEILRMAPLGDPIELRLRGYALSIRRAEAAQIMIRELGK